MVSAVRPWRKALRRERPLPSGVVGPVLLSALRRLVSICLSELIDDQLEIGFVSSLGRAQSHSVMARQLAWSVADRPQSAFASPLVSGRGRIFIGMAICRRKFWARLLPQS